MAGLSPRPNCTLPPSPQTPTKERQPNYSSAINEIVASLRNDDGLAIAPREWLFSPAKNKDLPGDKLYSRIQFLYTKERPRLMEQIGDFKLALKGHLCRLSGPERTDLLYNRLADLVWMARERVDPSPKRPHKSDSSKKVDLKPRVTRITSEQLGFTQTKPACGFKQPDFKPGGIKNISTKTSANTSFSSNASSSKDTLFSKLTTANTSFTTTTSFESNLAEKDSQETDYFLGSSPSEGIVTEAERNLLKAKRVETGAPSDVPPSKRRRSDENNGRLSPDSKPKPQCKMDEVVGFDLPELKPETMQHQIRNLPRTGFGTDPYARPPKGVPFAVVVERARAVMHGSLQVGRVDGVYDRKAIDKLLEKKPHFQHSPLLIWDAVRFDAATRLGACELTFAGALEWSTENTGPLLQTRMHPLRSEKACRVQRHFGWDRVFYLSIPSLTDGLPGHIKWQRRGLLEAFHRWLLTPLVLLGRTWRAFHFQELKRKSGQKKNVHRTHRVIFFAVSGPGITTVPIETFLNWMIPFRENLYQQVCKAFARIDLMVSTTTPTVQFRPDRIRAGTDKQGIDDLLSTGELEDDGYLETHPRVPSHVHWKQWEKREVMSDGCAQISVGAALEIRRQLGILHHPSAFQARINGAKGMWHVSAAYETSESEHLDVWIEIRKSQLKVNFRPEDFDLQTCEADRWSFDVVSFSRPLKPSELHRDFLQIMEDRGVPRELIQQVFREGLEAHSDELETMVNDPEQLALWRQRDSGYEDDGLPDDFPGLPITASGRIRLLSERAGFLPRECPPLAEAVMRRAEFQFDDLREKLRASCISSTMVVGIADPYQVLKPGEVHLSLSAPMFGKGDEQSFDMFAGKDVLVARHPTLRGSDMQRVRCVFRPELAHIKDVVVMSTRGEAPLAAKLQGGDYDGDTFWICAEERICKYFRNVKVPAQAGIDEFGIGRECRTLESIVPKALHGTEEHANAWLGTAFEFRLKPDMLGIITNHLYDLSYTEKTLWSKSIMAMADLHDLIIDAAKNGYSFDEEAFQTYLRMKRYPRPSEIEPPKYSKKARRRQPGASTDKLSLLSVMEIELEESGRSRRPMHILDDVLFNLINPLAIRALKRLANTLEPAKLLTHDADLEFPLAQVERLTSLVAPADLRKEKAKVKNALIDLSPDWLKGWKLHREQKERESREIVASCFQRYNAIRPSDPENLYWHMRSAETAPTNWECFKVAYMARDLYRKRQNFMFHAARDTVVYLKSHSKNGAEVVGKVSRIMKPKKQKPRAMTDDIGSGMDVSDTEDEFGLDVEDIHAL